MKYILTVTLSEREVILPNAFHFLHPQEREKSVAIDTNIANRSHESNCYRPKTPVNDMHMVYPRESVRRIVNRKP